MIPYVVPMPTASTYDIATSFCGVDCAVHAEDESLHAHFIV